VSTKLTEKSSTAWSRFTTSGSGSPSGTSASIWKEPETAPPSWKVPSSSGTAIDSIVPLKLTS